MVIDTARGQDARMHVVGTDTASQTIAMVRARGRERLTMVLSNGCCDSSAPYLFDDFLPDATAEQVGDIGGVPVLAPAWLIALYPGGDAFVVDVIEQIHDDSLSLETDLDRRFILRAPGAR